MALLSGFSTHRSTGVIYVIKLQREIIARSSQPSNFLLARSSRYINIPQVTLFLLASAVFATSYLLEPIRADHQTSHTHIITTYIQLNQITPQTLHKPSTTPSQPRHSPSVIMARLSWALNHLVSQSSSSPEPSSDSGTSSDSGSSTSCSDIEEPAPVLFHGPHGRFNHAISLAKNSSRICGFKLKGSKKQCGLVFTKIEGLRRHLKNFHQVELAGNVAGRKRYDEKALVKALSKYFSPGGEFETTGFANPQHERQRKRIARKFLWKHGHGARSSAETSSKRASRNKTADRKVKKILIKMIEILAKKTVRHGRKKSRASA
jgi:hypothetical protein